MSTAQCQLDARCAEAPGHAGPCRTLARRFADALIKIARKAKRTAMTRRSADEKAVPR